MKIYSFSNINATIKVTTFSGFNKTVHSDINIMYAINSALKHRAEYKNTTIVLGNYDFTYAITENSTRDGIIKDLINYFMY